MAGDLSLKLVIRADGSAAITELKRLDKGLESTGKAAKDAAQGTTVLGSAMKGLAAGVAAIGFGRLVGEFIRVNSESQRLRAQLVTLTGSVAGAGAAWNQLSQFAAQTPNTIDQVVRSFAILKARGLDASIPSLRAFADTASATGKSLEQMAEAVADAATGEFERLKEFGILASAQGAQITLTFNGVTKTVERSAAAISQALREIGEANFAGAAQREMETLGGSISNLTDSVYQLWTAMGDTGAANALASAISYVAGVIGEATGRLDGFNKGLGFTKFESGADQQWALWGKEAALFKQYLAKAEELRAAAAKAPAFGSLLGSLGIGDGDAAKLARLQDEVLGLAQALGETKRQIALNTPPPDGGMAGVDKQITSYRELVGVLYEMEKAAKIPAGVMETIKRIETGTGLDTQVRNPSSGARGLWQFMPGTEKMYGYGDSIMSQTKAAVQYVQDAIARGGADLENIFSSYVAGMNWKTAKRSPEAEAYRKQYVADSIATYKEIAAAQASGNADMQKQLGELEKNELASWERRLAADTKYGDLRAQLLAQQQGRIAEIEAEYAAKIRDVRANEDASPAEITATVAALEEARSQAILQARQETADKTLDIAKRSMDAETKLRVQAAQEIAAIERDTSLSAEERAARVQLVLRGLQVDVDKLAEAHDKLAIKIPSVYELWAETLKQLGRSIQGELADAFEGLFNGTIRSAKEAMDKLKDVILSSLAQLAAALVMRPINVAINGVLGTSAALSSGAAGASGLTGGGGGGFSLGGIANWFGGNSMGQTIATAIGEGFRYLGASPPAWLVKGGFNLAGASNLALGAGALGGGLLGNALFGDKGYGSLGSSIGSTAGAVIGSMILPGIGTILGGLLGGTGGGFLGSLFGGEEQKAPVAWIDLQGGKFKGTKSQGMTDDMVQGILQAVDTVNAALAGVADLLGEDAKAVLAGVSRSAPQALSPDQIEGWLKAEAERMVGYMANAVPGTLGEAIRDAFADADGNLQQFLAEVAQLQAIFAGLPEVVASLAEAGYDLGDAAETAAFELVKAAGGLEAFKAAQQGLDKLFLSPQEIQEKGFDALRKAFSELGLTLPTTREALESLVGGLDLTTEGGRQSYLAIAAMADALGIYYDAADAAAEATRQAAEAMAKMRQEAADALREGLWGATFGDQAYAKYQQERARQEANTYLPEGVDIGAMSDEEFLKWINQMYGSVEAFVNALGAGADDFVAAWQAWRTARAAAEAAAAAAGGGSAGTSGGSGTAVSPKGGYYYGKDGKIYNAGGNPVWAAGAYVDGNGNLIRGQPTRSIGISGRDLGGVADAADAASKAISGLRDSLLDWVRRTRGEVQEMLRPQSLDVTQSQFAAQLALAQGGNAAAMDSITEYADRYLQAAKAMSTTRGGYEEVVGFVTARVEALTRKGRGSGDPTFDELSRLREEARAADLRMISLTDKMQRYMALLERWEAIGMPAARA